MARARILLTIAVCVLLSTSPGASSVPVRAQKGMVASQSEIASRIGADVIGAGGTAVDAAVATAFALAVVHPTAGNIGGGGFIVYRPARGEPVAYDFREMAPAKASPTMFMKDGKYSAEVHHNSHLAVGVPGHRRRPAHGVEGAGQAAVEAARRAGGRARPRRLHGHRRPRALAQERAAQHAEVSGVGRAVLEERDALRSRRDLKQPDLARTLDRIATQGPAGFYEGETALLLEKEMLANGGLITREDLKNYAAKKRTPVQGHLSRLRGDLDAAGQLRRRGARSRC